MKVRKEKRIETTEIVEVVFPIDEVKEILISYNFLREFGSPFFGMDDIFIDAGTEIEGGEMCVVLTGHRTTQNGEY